MRRPRRSWGRSRPLNAGASSRTSSSARRATPASGPIGAYTPPRTDRKTGAERIAAHEALIDACDILSRAMGRSGEDNSWRRLLGDDRREVGDFACFVHCNLGLRA